MKLDAENRYIAHINPQAAGYKNTEVEPLYQTIVDRFPCIPGVTLSVIAIAIVVPGMTAASAGLIPARRAASIDPVRALRIE